MTQRSLVQRWTYDLTRTVARLAAVVLFRIRCEGRGRVPADTATLICANHQSFLDPILVGLACNRRLTFLARESLFRWGPFGRLLVWYDTVPIKREGVGIGGLKETLRRLKQGQAVLVFPEGTRSRDGRVGNLQPGFCALVRRGRALLVPVGIDGAFEVWPRWRRWPRPRTIHLHFGPPINQKLADALTDDQLVEELGRRIRQCQTAARRSRLRSQKFAPKI